MNINSNGVPYALRDALKNIKINGLMSGASVFILVACLVIMGSSLLLTLNIDRFVSKIEGQNEIVLFLEESNTAEMNTEIGEKLKDIDNVSEVLYVSKDQSFDELKQELNEQAYLLDQIKDDNPLRNSFHVKIKDLKKYDEALYGIKSIEGIAKIGDKKEFITKIIKVREVFSMLSVWVVLILLFMSLFIISNTVRIAMFTRKLEINIMKFVGATDNFIRLPFIIEGLILGALSGLVSVGLQWFLYSKLIVPLMFELSLFKPLMFSEIGLTAFWLFLLGGIVIGAVGSILPMRKYLRV